ncbi:glycosyltransferase family 2 protein [Gottfriedia acidiceleris]|uniref:glycosyltransferase family 2 protein n=1 Tax=Gottfriedia acidiceleris TaxID=371036 RepID=UPI00339B76F4
MSVSGLVSVIVPIFNAEKYLSRCIDSILQQSYKSFEVILINDGSTDKSKEICLDYSHKDERIKFIQIENHGPGYARNMGLKIARGEYIQFTDSDDSLPLNYLETMVSRIEQDNSDIVICGIKNIKNAQTLNKFTVDELLSARGKALIDLFVNLLDRGLAYSPCNKLYRSEIIKFNNIHFGVDFNLGEDALFNISYFKRSKYCSIENRIFYEYHQNNGSLINSYSHNKYEIQTLLYKNLRKLVNEVPGSGSINKMCLYYQYELTFVFTNYYLPDCSLSSTDRRKMISTVMHCDIVQEIFNIPNQRSNLQKIIRTLVRIKNVTAMDLFLRAYSMRYL